VNDGHHASRQEPADASLRSSPVEEKQDMATPKVEFHFDFGSPNAYLSHLVIPQIEKRTGATFE